jgi:hypothetical protein
MLPLFRQLASAQCAMRAAIYAIRESRLSPVECLPGPQHIIGNA